jgi:Arc/MetJ family transcription regulator
MRTNIILDDALVEQAMKAGPFKTRKEAVDAGLRLLARQAAYRDILALRGKLRWEDAAPAAEQLVMERPAAYAVPAAKDDAR